MRRRSAEIVASAYSPTPAVTRTSRPLSRSRHQRFKSRAVRIGCIKQSAAIRTRRWKNRPARRSNDRFESAIWNRRSKNFGPLGVAAHHAVVEIDEPPIGRPAEPVDVASASAFDDFLWVLPLSVGQKDVVAERSSAVDVDHPLTVWRPPESLVAVAVKNSPRHAAERSRNHPRRCLVR